MSLDDADLAIKVDGLSKCYQVYARPEDRLKQSFMPRLQRLAMRTPKAYYQEFWALRNVSIQRPQGRNGWHHRAQRQRKIDTAADHLRYAESERRQRQGPRSRRRATGTRGGLQSRVHWPRERLHERRASWGSPRSRSTPVSTDRRLRGHRRFHRAAGQDLFQRHVCPPRVRSHCACRCRHAGRRRSALGRRRRLRPEVHAFPARFHEARNRDLRVP